MQHLRTSEVDAALFTSVQSLADSSNLELSFPNVALNKQPTLYFSVATMYGNGARALSAAYLAYEGILQITAAYIEGRGIIFPQEKLAIFKDFYGASKVVNTSNHTVHFYSQSTAPPVFGKDGQKSGAYVYIPLTLNFKVT